MKNQNQQQFDASALHSQIENVDSIQQEIKTRIDQVYDALYEPDEGLFARIKESTEEARKADAKHSEEIENLNSWRVDADLQLEAYNKLNSRVDDIEEWRGRTVSVGKWVLGIWTTTMGGILVKFLYDLFSNHIRFI